MLSARCSVLLPGCVYVQLADTRRDRDQLSLDNEELENYRKKSQREMESLQTQQDELANANAKLEKTKKRLTEEVSDAACLRGCSLMLYAGS